MMNRFLGAPLAALFLMAFGEACYPVYAPPVRAVHSGAPGRIHEGEVEIGGTMAGVTTPFAGSVHVAYGVHDWVSLEGGGTFIGTPSAPLSAMGWVGPRFTLPRRTQGPSLLLDLELGIGAGVGGERCSRDGGCASDHLGWSDRVALGGYEGGAVGFGYRWFSLYLRGRMEQSVATNIPVTFWPSGLLGVGFDLGRHVSLDAGGGFMGYFNGQDAIAGPIWQTSLTFRFGRQR
jgi:hypothetical protein